MKLKSFIIIGMVLLTSCDSSQPDISFTEPFPKRNKNLQWKLGGRFSILKNNDTIPIKVVFNKNQRRNLLIQQNTNDTFFNGTVSKYRGLYFLDHQMNDSSYIISAIDIDKSTNTIRGLGTAFFQNLMLQNQIKQGNLDGLIQNKTADNKLRLRPDKKLLHEFFFSIIDSFPADTIIQPVHKEEVHGSSLDSIVVNKAGVTNEKIDEPLIIKKVYPNPAKEHCYIETHQAKRYHINLYNSNGKNVQNYQMTGTKGKIDLGGLRAGTYVLQVYSLDKKQSETKKIIRTK